jgi:type II secretory pathway component PulJ
MTSAADRLDAMVKESIDTLRPALDEALALRADRDSLRALLEEAKATIHEAGEQLWLLARDRKNPPLIVKECADMRDRITARLNEDRP